MDFLAAARELFPYTQALRRDFHRHPELGYQEVRTAGIVARELTGLGMEVTTGIAETGVIGLLEGDRPGPTVLLRFDMDALPIQEETGAPYASLNPGVMHACGHDGHLAVGLTVARLFSEQMPHFPGTLKFVFQPAEEGLNGAARMIEEGLLDEPRPQRALALHLWNVKPVGWVGATTGPVMAASERFKILLEGKGGHGASPHLAVDPVLAAAQIITAAQSIVARNVAPLDSAVITFGTVHAGSAYNIIPGDLEIEGTIRTYDARVRQRVLTRFINLVQNVATAMDCTVDVQLRAGTPAVVNHPELTARVQALVPHVLPGATLDANERTMGSEDMAFILNEVPGCYFFVGSANHEKGLDGAHHNPAFDFDEEALPRAAALMAAAVMDFLQP